MWHTARNCLNKMFGASVWHFGCHTYTKIKIIFLPNTGDATKGMTAAIAYATCAAGAKASGFISSRLT